MNRLVGVISFSFFVLNTLLSCSVLYLFVILKLLVPLAPWRRWMGQIIIAIAEFWIHMNNLNFRWTQKIQWQVEVPETLERGKSYLVLANHQSWTDIPVLQRALYRKVPFLRFFIKSELIWVPVLGLAWWALDFPRVKRYSKEYLAKHPEKKGRDLAETRKSCEKFKENPVSVLNFVEGTRFTRQKYEATENPSYQHLLPVKAGGVAAVLDAMGEQFAGVIDVTIVYPEGARSLMGLFFREIPRVTVHAQYHEIPSDCTGPDSYSHLKSWLEALWKEKDRRISEILKA